ncbi:MAG: hypothetical protein WBP11_15085 [Dokdonella sp.]
MAKQSEKTNATKLLAAARRLGWRNRWQQRDRRFVAIVVAVVAVAILALVWLANAYATSIADGVTHALSFPIVIVVIVGWIAMSIAARHLRQSRRDAERSWLAALPLGEGAFAVAARRQFASFLATALLLLLTLLLGLSWLLELSSRSVVTLSLLLIVGTTLGAAIGWTLARKDPRPSKIRLPSNVTSTKTQRFALGRWPLRHSRAHADLALHARAIGVLLLSLPIGVPPQAVVAMIVFGLAALTIWDVARALLTTTRLAGAWLRSLPFDARKATLALGGRSIFTIVVAAAIMLVVTALPMEMSFGKASAIILATGGTGVGGYLLLATVQRPFGARR